MMVAMAGYLWLWDRRRLSLFERDLRSASSAT